MPADNIVVVGGSAGALEGLRAFVEPFPADVNAAVIFVSHLPARGKGIRPNALTRNGSLPIIDAEDGLELEAGYLYFAQPDRHLLIADGHIHLTRGPKEGLHRPSINFTFRSAAAAYRERVIGVVLSGLLDDGASGLWEIAAHGGKTMIQDPEEAKYSDMPINASRDLEVDYVLKLHEMGPVIAGLVSGGPMERSNDDLRPETRLSRFSGITCPECHGPLWEKVGGPGEFECRVGHRFGVQQLLEEHTTAQEKKLYEAILALEEGARIAALMAGKSEGTRSQQFCEEAEQLRSHANGIRKMVEERLITPID